MLYWGGAPVWRGVRVVKMLEQEGAMFNLTGSRVYPRRMIRQSIFPDLKSCLGVKEDV
jgi:hypothetical protein